MAVLKEMETEARAMLADSRDYHTLDGAFLLVRDGINVWLCRQRGDSVALDDCERLLCVATEEAKPLTMAEFAAHAVDVPTWSSKRPNGMMVYDDKGRWTVEAYDPKVMGIPSPFGKIYNPMRSADGERNVSPEEYGFEEWHTGGGCTAYRLDLDDGGYLMLTDSGGCGLPALDDDESPMLGRYNAEGDGVAAVENFAALPDNGTEETPLEELERLHEQLRFAHESETDDDTDFDTWVKDQAAVGGADALRYMELDKILDYQ